MIYKDKPKKKNERKMFRLDDELLTKLNRLSKLEQKDLSTTIRELLEEAIEIKEKYYQKHLELLRKIVLDDEEIREEKIRAAKEFLERKQVAKNNSTTRQQQG